MVGLANALRILGFTSEGPGPIRVRGVGLNELTTVIIPYKVLGSKNYLESKNDKAGHSPALRFLHFGRNDSTRYWL